MHWTRQELLRVCALYFSIPFGKMHKGNPDVKQLAAELERTNGSVAMKLVNFASLDPEHQKRGVKGLGGVSAQDRTVFAEFREGLRLGAHEVEELLPEPEREIQDTEALRTVKARRVQGFFRRMVLTAYGNRCCITGNPVPELLVASHILPWSTHEQLRLEPTNGLCLSATWDKAFDRCLISFDEEYRLLLSPRLRGHLPNEELEREFVSRQGQPLRLPERFLPSAEFLRQHRGGLR